MLLSVKYLSNYKIEATDGSIGQVYGFLFDDQSWIIRYLVVDTGLWLPGRRVLISPSALGKPEGQMQVFPIELTREQIRNSPDIDTEKTISREQQEQLHSYYNWATYWNEPFGAAVMPPPAAVATEAEEETAEEKEKKEHLRSTREVIDYKLHASDGKIGHIDDFIIHDEDWIIRYIVIATGHWLSGRKVIIPPDWITKISWEMREVFVDVPKEMVKGSPAFNPGAAVNREYEIRLYDYYGRPKYWS